MEQILSASGIGWKLLTLKDFPDLPEVEETGETFYDNAKLKAFSAMENTGCVAIADDGGLVIDALGGAPGVKSHRFLGVETGFDEKMERILEMMQGVSEEQRTCRFVCCVVLAFPSGSYFSCTGVCEGRIAYKRQGTYGFGYDPIVLLPELGKHVAELTPEEKHCISHRGKALASAIRSLKVLYLILFALHSVQMNIWNLCSAV